MNDLAYWTKKLQEAKRELEAAKTRTAVNAAAKRVQMAKAELKRLEAKRSKGRGASRASSTARR
jgi:hypothetical protein